MAERKHGNGEGSKPHQRPDGRWETSHYVDGKHRGIYGKIIREVAPKLIDALDHKDEPKPFVSSHLTVAEFFGRYEESVKETIRPRSFETNHDIARLHLLPALEL